MMMGMMVMMGTSTRSSTWPAGRIYNAIILSRSRQQPVMWLRWHIGTRMVTRLVLRMGWWPVRMMMGRVGRRLLLRLLRLLTGVLWLRRRLLLMRRRRMATVLLRRMLVTYGATTRTGR